MQSRWPIATLFLVLTAQGLTSIGAEFPEMGVTVVDEKTVYTATPDDSNDPTFKPHINFPELSQRYDGSFTLWFGVGQTQSPSKFFRSAESFDEGETWQLTPANDPLMTTPQILNIRPPGQISKGFYLSMNSGTPVTNFSIGGKSSSDGGRSWFTSGAVSFDTNGLGYVSLTQTQQDVVKIGSTLMFSAYGRRTAGSPHESVLFVSNDDGATWVRRSTISQYVPGLATSMGTEGPSETGVIDLDNGNLLAVFRTGQPFPNPDINAVAPSLFTSISTDQGLTWSTPKMLGATGVFPHLTKLSDGKIALSYGRYGVKLMFADETGTRWSKPTIIHDESSSGHARVYERSDGKYVISYDQSSFYPPGANSTVPPEYIYANEQYANMKIGILDIQDVSAEDVAWSLEYHGDVAPDTLAVPWTSSSTGSPSVFYWADLGQDYIRTNTELAGPGDHSISYALPASTPGSAWADVDLAEGFVLETRARVGSTTSSEDASTIFLSDGENGSVAMKLTGGSVQLEGLGGSAAEVEYTTSANPSFSTLDWHDYRLVVRPDASLGGALTALLTMDDRLILSKELEPSALDELRFGDQAGSSNGIMDVDFLRFAPLPEEAIWSADRLGNWQEPGNWLGARVPNGLDETIVFGAAIKASQTLVTDEDVYAANIRFENAHRYVISGQGTLHLSGDGQDALVHVVQGAHELQVPVTLHSNTQINLAAGTELDFNGVVDLLGNDLVISGSGNFSMNNQLLTRGGSVMLAGGSLSGSGLIAGTLVNNAGLVEPGNSPGVLRVLDDYIQASDGALRIELTDAISDQLHVGGVAYLAGLLEVQLLDGFQPSAGDEFKIFDLAEAVGAFDLLRLPALKPGLAWSTSELYSEGLLAVTAIPEPVSLVLWTCGMAGICTYRKPRCMTKTEASGQIARQV